MIFGRKHIFAIESKATSFLDSESQMSIGFFNIYIDSIRYGVRKDDATVLGTSYYEVMNRIHNRGKHKFSKEIQLKTIDIIGFYQKHYYGEGNKKYKFNNYTEQELFDELVDNKIVWAPDGDAAFDDGSHVLQIDNDNTVRIIGFINEFPPESISEVSIPSDLFYEILKKWSDGFHKDWYKNK